MHFQTRQGMSVYVGPEATSAVKPAERDFSTADLLDAALAVRHDLMKCGSELPEDIRNPKSWLFVALRDTPKGSTWLPPVLVANQRPERAGGQFRNRDVVGVAVPAIRAEGDNGVRVELPMMPAIAAPSEDRWCCRVPSGQAGTCTCCTPSLAASSSRRTA